MSSDFNYWADNMDDIKKWMCENATGYWDISGVVLTLEKECDMMWFISRWG
jgi:hypothetical protein